MGRIWFAAPLALCACLGSMVRAPEQIPASGVVECTDTMEVPIAAAIVAVASAGTFIYSMAHLEGAIDHGGVLWVPLLGTLSVDTLFAAGLGHSYVDECRDAKRRGAELVLRKHAQAEARAQAGTLWKRAASAARGDDCATVRELDPKIRELDVEFHDVVFARDVAIARCLATRE